MRIVFLGTGTPSPSLSRQSSGCLIEIGESRIVLDHGGGAHQRLLEAGYRPEQVTDLILTHLHSDHILDVPRLVLGRWDQNSALPPLRVTGPAPVETVFDRLFGPEGAFAPDIEARLRHPASLAIYAARGGTGERPRPRFEIATVRGGDRIGIAGLPVEVGTAQHFEPLLDCLCYRFPEATGDIVFTGDTGHSEAVIRFAAGCRMMIAMCQYLHGTPLPEAARRTAASHLEVAGMAAAAGAAILVLTHLSAQFDDPLVRAKAQQEMQRIFPGRIVWAEDLMVLDTGAGEGGARFD